MQMEISIKELIDLARRMVEVFIILFQEMFMKENLKTKGSMVKAC